MRRSSLTVPWPSSAVAVVVAAALLAGCAGGPAGPVAQRTTDAGAPSPASPASLSPAAATASSAPSVAPTAGPTAVPSHPAGTGHVLVASAGFAITLPDGWVAIPLDGSSTAEIEALLPPGSSIAAALDKELADASAAGFAIMAIDLRPATVAAGNASTLNVNAQGPSQLGLSLLQPLAVGLLDQAPGVTNVVSTQVTLPAGRALRITYTLATTTSSGAAVKLAATQFVLLSSKHTYTTTFACQYAAAASGRSQADSIMKRFDIL
jgi:hypothetical protein